MSSISSATATILTATATSKSAATAVTADFAAMLDQSAPQKATLGPTTLLPAGSGTAPVEITTATAILTSTYKATPVVIDKGRVATSYVDQSGVKHRPVSVSGKVDKNFGTDVKGETDGIDGLNFSSSGPLTSGGQKITVTEQPPITSDIATYNPVTGKTTFAQPGPSVYTGTTADGKTAFTLTINSDGTYKFTQDAPLDDANGKPITLKFGVTATNANGATDTGIIKIKVFG